MIKKILEQSGVIFLAAFFLLVFSRPLLAVDGYEPDNTYGTASSITVNTFQDRDIDPADDLDYISFSATAGQSYIIETSDSGVGTSVGDTELYLYDTDGTTQLAYDDCGGSGCFSKITWACPSSGTYYFRVQSYMNWGTGTYRITVTETLPGSIAGTVYDTAASTLGSDIIVELYVDDGSGNPCWSWWVDSTMVNPDGTYSFPVVGEDNYYLRASDMTGTYAPMWWDSSGSVSSCDQAEVVAVGSGATVTGRDFQLPLAAQVSGTVYDSSGVPLPDTIVSLIQGDPCGLFNWINSYWVGVDGTYTISVPPGSYYVIAEDWFNNEHVSEWWASPASSPDCSQAQLVTVGEGATRAGVDFQLDPFSHIQGTVVDNSGSPIPDGVVEVFSGNPCNPTYVTNWWVNPDGTYDVPVPAGDFFLQAYDWTGNHGSEWWADPASVHHCFLAETVTAGVGQTVTGKNFQLDLPSTLSGTVLDAGGVPPVDGPLEVTLYSGYQCDGQYVDSMTINPDGTYSFTGLPPGEYLLLLNDYSYTFGSGWRVSSTVMSDLCEDAQYVTVGVEQDVTGVDFQVVPPSGTNVTGTVYDDAGSPVVGGGAVIAMPSDPDGACGAMWQYIGWIDDPSGTYEILLPPGDYFLLAYPFNFFEYLQEFWADPASTHNCNQAQAITVGSTAISGKDFQLDAPAQVSGTVFDSAANPLENVWVFFGYGDPCEGGGYGMSTWTDPSGNYSLPGIPPGQRYLVADPDNYWNGTNYAKEWWAEPASSPSCADAQTIHFASGDTVTGKNFQLDDGATISGTVYDSSGNPLFGGWVDVFTGDPCGGENYSASTIINPDGTYTVPGLTAGDHYLSVFPWDNLVVEWWASPASSPDCSQAQKVTLAASGSATGKDFQLDPGASISGTVYDRNGYQFMTPFSVAVFTDNPCDLDNQVTGITAIYPGMGGGDYTVEGLLPGDYYLQAAPYASIAHTSEYWADPASTVDCTKAQSFTVPAASETTGKDFHLGQGTRYITVTTSASPTRGGTVEGSGTYGSGNYIELKAVPASERWFFVRWSGNAAGTSNPMQIYGNTDKDITAIFEKKRQTFPVRGKDGSITILSM